MENHESRKLLLFSLIVAAVFIIFMATNGFGLGFLLTGKTIDESKLSIGNSPVLGDENAPITIYEFSDFSCPYCAAADGKNQQVINSLKASNPSWQAPLPEIIKEYVETGKAKIVFKYFPGHGSGRIAHLIALSLNEQNLFWEFHDAAFANQADVGDLIKMKALAQSLGADMQKLESEFNSGKYASQLEEDEAMGKALGITGTPAFIINGNLIKGAKSFPEFQKVIEKELQ